MSTPTGNRAMQETFRQAARTYELANHVLTLGLDIVWRRAAARTATSGLESPRSMRWLDLCTGTGDMAAELARRAPVGTQLVAVDLTPAMLAQARARRDTADVAFAVADVRALPCAEGTLDLVTISFATRNVNHSRAVLLEVCREVRRVLRPGGRFVMVETSQPPNGVVRWLFHRYIALAVRPIGQVISGSRAAYAYLSYTIPRFYTAEELATLLRESGFGTVEFTPLMLGAAAIHVANKESAD